MFFVLFLLVRAARAGCQSNDNCAACVDEVPGSLIEGLVCQMCDNKGSPRCVGDFADNLGLVSCDVKAKTTAECAAKFPTLTTRRTAEPTLPPTPSPPLTAAPTPPAPPTSSVPFFTAPDSPAATPSADAAAADDTVAIAVGVVVALVVLGLFVLAGVYIVVKYRKQAHAYPLPHDASHRPSFSLHSGRVLDDPTTYSGRNTYTDNTSNLQSQRYTAMPYNQPEPTGTPQSTIPRSSSAAAKQQYYDLNVIKPPPKDVDLDGTARDAASSRSYVMATELPDIPAGYSGQRANLSAQDDIDVLNELVVPDTQEVPMTTGEHVAADLVPVSERMEDMDSGRLANEFAAMQAMLDDV